MSDERLLALLLAGVGAAATGRVALMSRSPAAPALWYELHFPRKVDADGVTALFRSFASDRRRSVIAIELVATGKSLRYRLGVSRDQAASITAAVRTFVPGISVQLIAHDIADAPRYAWGVRLSSRRRPLRIDGAEQIARSIVTALSTIDEKETVVLQWLLGPRLVPHHVGTRDPRPSESWSDTLRTVAQGNSKMDSDERRALQHKVGDAGFRSIGRIGIAGATEGRARLIAGRLLAALRLAEAPGVRIDMRTEKPDDIAAAAPARDWPLSLNAREITAVTGWPLGDGHYPGVRGDGPVQLPATSTDCGRVVGRSTFPGDVRKVGLAASDALQHAHVLGPTGVGKSTLLLNLIVQDMDAGRGVVVIDPKGDLVDDVLGRVPRHRRDDVVVLDPGDAGQPVGLNVLHAPGRSPELVADQVLAVFHGLYEDSWGPRTQDILHASLLTLAGRPDMTLCALPVLLSNEAFRRRIVGTIDDQIALGPFWHWFEAISEGERAAAIAPVMNKLRAFLLRPRMRAVIGQSTPKFVMDEVFEHRKILLVSLAKGLLGPEAAALLGSLVISQLWQGALGRVRHPAARRSPVMIYVDEFQDYLHLPTDLADVLAQARGLGVGLTLAHQHLAQLPPAMRAAVLSNARSRIVFQLGADDAKAIAGTAPELQPEDLQRLPRFEAYASLVHHGSSTPYASIRTEAPSPTIVSPQTVRNLSRQRYGVPIEDVDQEIARLVNGEGPATEKPVGRRKRT